MSPTRRAAALALLSAAGASWPLTRALAQGIEPTDTPDDDAPDTTLDTGEDRYDHMLAPVSINGQGPFNFLLDTGANVSCVSRRLADRLALQPQASARVHTMVGVRERPIVLLDELKVGPRHRKRVHVPALPMSGEDADGVLGVDWLKGQRLVLDFRQRRLEITRSRTDEGVPGRIVIVPARRRHGQLTIVDADLSGERISAIIDSGAQGTLCNTRLREIVRARALKRGRVEPPVLVRMETIAGESFTGEWLYLPFLRLGGLQLGNVPVTCADMHVFDIWDLTDKPALVIGMDLLGQFEQVALDFGRSKVRFEFT
jgi:predicted aspartyl protease